MYSRVERKIIMSKKCMEYHKELIDLCFCCLQIIRNVRVRRVDLCQSDKSLRIFSAILQKNLKFFYWEGEGSNSLAFMLSLDIILLFYCVIVCVCLKTSTLFFSFLFFFVQIHKEKENHLHSHTNSKKLLRGCGT